MIWRCCFWRSAILLAGSGLMSAATVALGVTPGSSRLGSAVILRADVTPADGGGKITFYDGVSVLGVAPVTLSGSATLSTRFLGSGTHALKAYYAGSNSTAI